MRSLRVAVAVAVIALLPALGYAVGTMLYHAYVFSHPCHAWADTPSVVGPGTEWCVNQVVTHAETRNAALQSILPPVGLILLGSLSGVAGLMTRQRRFVLLGAFLLLAAAPFAYVRWMGDLMWGAPALGAWGLVGGMFLEVPLKGRTVHVASLTGVVAASAAVVVFVAVAVTMGPEGPDTASTILAVLLVGYGFTAIVVPRRLASLAAPTARTQGRRPR